MRRTPTGIRGLSPRARASVDAASPTTERGGALGLSTPVVGLVLEQRGGDAEGGGDQGLRIHPQGHHAEGAEEDRQREG